MYLVRVHMVRPGSMSRRANVGFALRMKPKRLGGERPEVEELFEVVPLTALGERVMRPEFGCGTPASALPPEAATQVVVFLTY